MSEPTAAEILRRFDRRARRLENLGQEGLKLRGQGRITAGSLDAIFESAVLNLYTAFELLVEDLFFSVLLGDSGLQDAGGAVLFASRQQAESVLLGDKNYLSWLPFDKGVLPLAERLLVDGRPFVRLNRHDPELTSLEEIHRVRNAIAHQSASSQKKISGLTVGLRPGRRHVAGLLQHVQQGSTIQVTYSRTVRQVAMALADADDLTARNRLSAERPYQANSVAPAGRYQCTVCRARLRITKASDKLPPCPTCKAGHARGPRDWQRIYA